MHADRWVADVVDESPEDDAVHSVIAERQLFRVSTGELGVLSWDNSSFRLTNHRARKVRADITELHVLGRRNKPAGATRTIKNLRVRWQQTQPTTDNLFFARPACEPVRLTTARVFRGRFCGQPSLLYSRAQLSRL